MIFFNKVAFSKYLAVWLLSVSTRSSVATFLKLLNKLYMRATALQNKVHVHVIKTENVLLIFPSVDKKVSSRKYLKLRCFENV